MQFFVELLYRPIFNLMVYLYSYVPGHDLGIVIILITLIIRVVLYPLNRRAIVSQRALQVVQPKIEELKEKYKNDREKLGSEMMALYKTEKINPLSSCLPLLVQLPILIAVYQVFINGLKNQNFDMLYPFIANPGMMKTIAFGFLDLTQKSIILAVLAGVAQWWQTRMLMVKNQKVSTASAMNKQMMYLMPVMTIIIGSSFPSGLTLYWFATTALAGLQQVWMMRKKQITGQ
jgi:YidC/Oxa1 family membrane protein insertase